MRKKIAQCAGKALSKSSIYGLVVGALSIPVSGWAVETAKIIGTQAITNQGSLNGFIVWVDPATTNNVNGCAKFLNTTVSGWFGQDVAGFHIAYPADGAPSEAQKVMISQISLAVAIAKPVIIHSVSCDSSTYNSIDQLWVKAN